MKSLQFDFNNLLSANVTAVHGVSAKELESAAKDVVKAHQHLRKIISHPQSRITLALEWTKLPDQNKAEITRIQRLGDTIARKYENVLFLGIGGSYLGLKAAQDALAAPYYNEFSALRQGRARVYFEGNNLDPDTLSVLLKQLNPKRTFVVVISKSGETTETKAAFEVVERWLEKALGTTYGRRIIAITDPRSGSLRKKVDQEQAKDVLSFRSLALMEGVGGRFSELNMGLLHLALIGVKIQAVLDGARAMAKRCSSSSLYSNPAYLYALLQTILYRKKKKGIAVLMPFAETLKSTADWYVQLLAESLGKKYRRKIRTSITGGENWSDDIQKIVHLGRTPISARGTNDLHSIQQNNIEGENNKTITFIRVQRFTRAIRTPRSAGLLGGQDYSRLLSLAHEATEWALTRAERPNCTIIMPAITPYHWGELLFFLEMATAFEGELLGINAFHQPGVESYKQYMYYKLGSPGSAAIAQEIKNHPPIKLPRYIF